MNDKSKISVVLSSEEFSRFNSYCTEKGYKKSTLIKRLIREHMDRESYRSQGSTTTQTPVPAHAAMTRQARRSKVTRA